MPSPRPGRLRQQLRLLALAASLAVPPIERWELALCFAVYPRRSPRIPSPSSRPRRCSAGTCVTAACCRTRWGTTFRGTRATCTTESRRPPLATAACPGGAPSSSPSSSLPSAAPSLRGRGAWTASAGSVPRVSPCTWAGRGPWSCSTLLPLRRPACGWCARSRPWAWFRPPPPAWRAGTSAGRGPWRCSTLLLLRRPACGFFARSLQRAEGFSLALSPSPQRQISERVGVVGQNSAAPSLRGRGAWTAFAGSVPRASPCSPPRPNLLQRSLHWHTGPVMPLVSRLSVLSLLPLASLDASH